MNEQPLKAQLPSPEPSQAQKPKQTNPIERKYKPLTNKDKLFLKNLKEAKFNQTRAYQQTYPKASYGVARAEGCRKANSTAIRNNNVLNEIDEQWIVNKLKEFVLSSKKASDKIRATELLGKWKALFTDKTEQMNKTPDKIVIMYNKEPNRVNINE